MATGRGIRKLLIPLSLSVIAVVGLTVQTNARPPGIPSATAARTQLNELTVSPDGSMTGYSRDNFPTWIAIEGNCDTPRRSPTTRRRRNHGRHQLPANSGPLGQPVQRHHDHGVVQGPDRPHSPRGRRMAHRRLVLDHRPTPGLRERPDRPQLLAVDASDNESKGDRFPDEWMPPSTAFRCAYAEMYTHVNSSST